MIDYITLHYITLSAFQTPPTPKVIGGASTITCYTKYDIFEFKSIEGMKSMQSSELDVLKMCMKVIYFLFCDLTWRIQIFQNSGVSL